MNLQSMLRCTSLALLVCAAVSCTTDTGVTTTVKSKLLADESVRTYTIEVDTRDGVVTLTGNIDSQEAKDRAIVLARETKGVREVVDMIAVQTAVSEADAPDPDRSVGQHIDDAGITMSVKTKLLDDPMVRGLKIDVDTREGVVFLTGPVRNEAEKDRAIELAQAIEGVRRVEANLDVRG